VGDIQKMNKKIIFSSGGTGGHIFPAINLMKYFLKKGNQVLLVTNERSKIFLKKYPEIKFHILETDTPLNKNILKKILSLIVIFFSIIKSIIFLSKEKPHMIFGFGGHVSFPICFASIFFKIPLVIYENNLVLGRANKKLLPISKKVLLATDKPINFPKKYDEKIVRTGSILREEIISYSTVKKNNKKNFTILVLGGSQGAEVFGNVIPEAIEMIKNEGYDIEIYQQCLESQKDSLKNFYNKINVKNEIFVFSENILSYISSTDLAISRCGASSMAELVQTLTPFIAVPYPYSMDNHQYLNARYYEQKGCCFFMSQDNLNSNNLFKLVNEIIENKKKLENMKENMKNNKIKNIYSIVESTTKDLIKNEN